MNINRRSSSGAENGSTKIQRFVLRIAVLGSARTTIQKNAACAGYSL